MKGWTIRPGVVLTQVCEEYLLVATRKARGLCPYVKQINSTGVYYWTLLEQGMDGETMIREAAARYGVEPETIRPGLERYLAQLKEQGYLYGEDS